MILDSNIVIYAAEPDGGFLDKWVQDPAACVATVTQLEVLGFPRWHLLDEPPRVRLASLIRVLPALTLDRRIVERAIELRRQKKMSLGDSVIAATALVHHLPLVTRNEADFNHIPGLEIINPFALDEETASTEAP